MADLPEDLKNYYVALGRAVSNWQMAEERMELLFDSLAESAHAPFIFNAISSARDKLTVLDELMQRRFPGHAILANWNALHNKIGRMVKRRNRIVHGYPVRAPILGRTISPPVNLEDGNWEYLSGPAGLKRALLFDPGLRLKTFRNTLQITQLARAFELLTTQISVFGNLVHDAISQQKVSAAQSGG